MEKARVQAVTNFWPKLSGSLSRWFRKTSPHLPPLPHPPRVRQPSAGRTLINPPPACPLMGEYGESFLFTLANVLQVLPWGSVIMGHLRHRWREGNYWGGLPKRRGPCAGNEEHACVYAKISTRTPKAVWHPHTRTFSVTCTGLQSKHAHVTNKTTLARAFVLTCTNMMPWYILHTSTASQFTPPLLFTLSYSDSANFWSVTNGIYRLYVSWERLSLILEETQSASLYQR